MPPSKPKPGKSLQDTHPELCMEWSKNNDCLPSDFGPGSTFKPLWTCKYCSREWRTKIGLRTSKNTGCPDCKGNRISKVKTIPKLGNSLFELRPELSKEWSSKNQLTPKDYSIGSGHKVWWVCPNCDREYKAQIYSRSINNTGCIICNNYCSKPEKIIAFDIFVTRSRSKHGDKYKYDKESYTSIKDKTRIFCDIHGIFYQVAYHHANGHGCSYCAALARNQLICLPEDGESLADKFPLLIEEWDKNNIKSPYDVKYASNLRANWICKNCNHKWDVKISSRTVGGTSCPRCKSSRGEKYIDQILISNNINFTRQYRINECRDKRPLIFDFVILDNLKPIGLIEYNGFQHYYETNHKDSKQKLYDIRRRDKIKLEFCKNNHIPYLVIKFTNYNNIPTLIKRFMEKIH